jgi:uncharacterized delta-60 repeat protein
MSVESLMRSKPCPRSGTLRPHSGSICAMESSWLRNPVRRSKPEGLRKAVWRRRAGMLSLGALLAMSLGGSASAHAERSPLDPSFGRRGVVVTPTPSESWNGMVSGIAQDRKGRLVGVGTALFGSFAVLRYHADGTLDTTFRGGSVEKDPFYAGGLVQTTFGGEGGARDVALQDNGDIVAVGWTGLGLGPGSASSFALARYEESGARDPSFGRNGRVRTPLGENGGSAFAVAIQPNGKILVAGFRETRHGHTEGLLIRYLPNGAIDRDFGSHGEVRFATRHRGQTKLHDIAVLANGKILIAGGFHDDFMLARLLPDGRLDSSFGGGDGRVLTDVNGSAYCPSDQCAHANSLALSHGRIVLGGNAADTRNDQFMAVTRYRLDGRLDRGFGQGGIARFRRGNYLTAEHMVVLHDGRIVLAGEYTGKRHFFLAVVRLLPSGKPDPNFGNSGFFQRLIGSASDAYAALVQRDGKVVIGGVSFPKPMPPYFEGEEPLDNARFTLLRFR